MADEAPNSTRPQASRAPEHPTLELSSSLSILGLSVLLTLSGSEVENSGGESTIVKGQGKEIGVCDLPPEERRCPFIGREY